MSNPPPESSDVHITTQTQLSVTIATAIAIVATAIGATWNAANKLRDIRDELTELRVELRTELTALKREVNASEVRAWNKYDMRHWAFDLEKVNRTIKLEVPDPRTMRP